MKKLPPIEKIYEAYSAIADDRVVLREESAAVFSSNRAKEYIVTWKDGIYTSNDNASYWQGYAGYPMIAVFMLQGKLDLNLDTANYFKGINWTELNLKYKGKYAKAAEEIMDGLKAKGVRCDEIYCEIEKVYRQIEDIDITCKRSSTRPPSSNKGKL